MIGCDYPECPATTEVQIDDSTARRILPDGWADFSTVTLMDMRGTRYREFCPQHARVTLTEITEVLSPGGQARMSA